MTKLQSEQCAKIAKHYGEGSQLCILQEECAELIQAISKIRRSIPNAGTHLIEELADVCIMVEQVISYIMSISPTTRIMPRTSGLTTLPVCQKCGRGPLLDTYEFCPYCGRSIENGGEKNA